MSLIDKEGLENIRSMLLDHMVEGERGIKFFANEIGISATTLNRIIARKEVTFATTSKVINYLKRRNNIARPKTHGEA